MPAIKVYKSGYKLIPVVDAKLATAYQCPFTGDLFVTKRKYASHLKELRQDRMWANARTRQLNNRMEELWNQPSFDNIVRWVRLNSDVFWAQGKRNGWSSDAARWDKIRDDFQIEITYLDLTWSDSVSNTHDCPHNGFTNWGGREKPRNGVPVPRGYPGWHGNIEFRCSHDVPSFFSKVTEGSRIHTGTGGSRGKYHYGYSVRMFAADWPGVASVVENNRAQYEKDHLIDMIKNQYQPFAVPPVKIGTRRK